jgi:phosphoribosylglycinamide formyltransferase-1
MSTRPAVTVLISGRGSNLVALHENARGYRINAVVSNTPEAKGLEWAKQQGIPTVTVARQDYATLAQFKAAVLQAVRDTEPDLVALAGFMVVLQPEFVDEFAGKLINIHPSLLPKFPGLETHERALEAREKEHGATVHFVAAGVDTGAIIAQAAVPVHSYDTPESLAARTLVVEHKLYPWVLKYLATGDISLTDDGVVYTELVRSEARTHQFRLS